MASLGWRKSLLARSAINIIRKDWFECRTPILLLTAGMFLAVIGSIRSGDFSRGVMSGMLISASYGFAYFSFLSERQHGTLELLLALPIRPYELVIAKYASLYSMALFVANGPGLFLRDLHLLFLLNAFVLFLATLSMASTVISDKPWAALIPLWMALVFFMPLQKFLEKFYPDGLGLYFMITSHVTLLGIIALATTPFFVLISAFCFERHFA